jgi:hypothetical protein
MALALLLVGAIPPLQAAEEKAEQANEEANEKVRKASIIDRVRATLRLPQTVKESREEGVSEEKVREVLETARTRGVPAGETRKILETENHALRQGGNPDNFGAAVHQLKESGLRGRELAEAIHAEQIARGMKQPKMKMKIKQQRGAQEKMQIKQQEGKQEQKQVEQKEGAEKKMQEGKGSGKRKGGQ